MYQELKTSLAKDIQLPFWKNILHKSSNLEKPLVFKINNNSEIFEALKKTSFKAITDAIKEPKSQIKIYIDGKVISDPFRFLNDNMIMDGEEIENWKKRVIPESSFVMKMPNCIGQSDELHDLLEEFFKPLKENYGIPLGGISTDLEFGDHEWSPEGLKEERTPKKKIYINLGNSKDAIYQWSSDKKEEIGLKKKKGVVTNFEDYLLDYSCKNEVKANDLAVILEQGMHIVNHDQFFFNIQIKLNDLTYEELLQEMFFDISWQTITNKIRGEGAVILPVYNVNEFYLYTKLIFKHLQYFNYDLNLPLKCLLEQAFKDKSYKIKSNAGFIGSILPEDSKKIHSNIIKINNDSHISIRNIVFKIEYYKENENLHLFFRGQQIKIKGSNLIIKFIDKLNSNTKICWGNFLEENAETFEMNLEILKKFIAIMLTYRVIQIK
jgi:TATA-box binding protein (TBP) (component of TFIID and TFIIIB)